MSKGNDDLDDQDISFDAIGGLKVLVQIRVKSPRIIINWSLRNPSYMGVRRGCSQTAIPSPTTVPSTQLCLAMVPLLRGQPSHESDEP